MKQHQITFNGIDITIDKETNERWRYTIDGADEMIGAWSLKEQCAIKNSYIDIDTKACGVYLHKGGFWYRLYKDRIGPVDHLPTATEVVSAVLKRVENCLIEQRGSRVYLLQPDGAVYLGCGRVIIELAQFITPVADQMWRLRATENVVRDHMYQALSVFDRLQPLPRTLIPGWIVCGSEKVWVDDRGHFVFEQPVFALFDDGSFGYHGQLYRNLDYVIKVGGGWYRKVGDDLVREGTPDNPVAWCINHEGDMNGCLVERRDGLIYLLRNSGMVKLGQLPNKCLTPSDSGYYRLRDFSFSWIELTDDLAQQLKEVLDVR